MIQVISEVQLLILRNQYDRGHSCESKGMGNGDFWGKNLGGHQSGIWDPPGFPGGSQI